MAVNTFVKTPLTPKYSVPRLSMNTRRDTNPSKVMIN